MIDKALMERITRKVPYSPSSDGPASSIKASAALEEMASNPATLG